MTKQRNIKENDLFTKPVASSAEWSVRKTSKGFVYDSNNKICLLQVNGFYGLPGGGVEAGETYEQAFIRECKEEIGCDIVIDKELSTWNQHRDSMGTIYEIHYFVAHVIGEKGVPTTTEESEKTVQYDWFSEQEVESFLEEQITRVTPDMYAMVFNSYTHNKAYKEIKI